jgi:hypothetical protein
MNEKKYNETTKDIHYCLRMLQLNIASKKIIYIINKYNNEKNEKFFIEIINFIVNSFGTNAQVTDQFISILEIILNSNNKLFNVFSEAILNLKITCESTYSIQSLQKIVNVYSVKHKLETFS